MSTGGPALPEPWCELAAKPFAIASTKPFAKHFAKPSAKPFAKPFAKRFAKPFRGDKYIVIVSGDCSYSICKTFYI